MGPSIEIKNQIEALLKGLDDRVELIVDMVV